MDLFHNNKKGACSMTIKEIIQKNSRAYDESTERIASDIMDEIRQMVRGLYLPSNYELIIVLSLQEEDYKISIVREEGYMCNPRNGKRWQISSNLFTSKVTHFIRPFRTDDRLFNELVLAKVTRMLQKEGGREREIPSVVNKEELGDIATAIQFKVDKVDDEEKEEPKKVKCECPWVKDN